MKEISDLELVRKRPGMFAGDTTVRGLSMLPGELISNAIDEFLQSNSSFVSVEFDGRQVTVADDGGGLPFDQQSLHGNDCRMTDFLTRLHNTPSAENHAPHIHVHAMKGVGLFVVAALAEWLEIESVRDGLYWRQVYSRGVRIENDSVRPIDPKDIQKGTRLRFVGDPMIFGENQSKPKALRQILCNSAHLFPGLRVHLQDEVFYSPDGLVDLAATISPEETDLQFSFSAEVESMKITAVARGVAEEETQWHTWANGMHCHENGTHRDAFAEALSSVGWNPAVALIHALMLEPKFAGPTKTRLNIDEKKPALVAALKSTLASHIADSDNS